MRRAIIKQPDLFGVETPVNDSVVKGVYKSKKHDMLYRKSDSPFKRCKFCKYAFKVLHGSTNFYKCKLIGVSYSSASDVKPSFVCKMFKEISKGIEQ